MDTPDIRAEQVTDGTTKSVGHVLVFVSDMISATALLVDVVLHRFLVLWIIFL